MVWCLFSVNTTAKKSQPSERITLVLIKCTFHSQLAVYEVADLGLCDKLLELHKRGINVTVMVSCHIVPSYNTKLAYVRTSNNHTSLHLLSLTHTHTHTHTQIHSGVLQEPHRWWAERSGAVCKQKTRLQSRKVLDH